MCELSDLADFGAFFFFEAYFLFLPPWIQTVGDSANETETEQRYSVDFESDHRQGLLGGFHNCKMRLLLYRVYLSYF